MRVPAQVKYVAADLCKAGPDTFAKIAASLEGLEASGAAASWMRLIARAEVLALKDWHPAWKLLQPVASVATCQLISHSVRWHTPVPCRWASL